MTTPSKDNTEGNTGTTKTRLIPLTDWPKHHPYPPLGGLRHLVFTMPTGFDKVVRRVNRRVLIDEAAWFAWVEEQNQEGTNNV